MTEWEAHMRKQADTLVKEDAVCLHAMCDALVALSHTPLTEYCSKEQLDERERQFGIIEGKAYRRRMIASQLSTIPEQYWRKHEVQASQEGVTG